MPVVFDLAYLTYKNARVFLDNSIPTREELLILLVMRL